MSNEALPGPSSDAEEECEAQSSNNNHPVPPPFNPIGPPRPPATVLSNSAAEAAVVAAKGASVVPDLMRVYESLTQSSTPQNDSEYHDTADADAQAQAQYSNHAHNVYHPYDLGSDQQQQQQQQQQPMDSQFGGYAQAWTYDSSVPGAQYSEHPYVPPAAPAVSNNDGTPTAAAVDANSTSVGARSLRKRTAPATSFANNSNSINSNNNRDDSSSASMGENTSATRSSSKARRKGGKDSDGRWSKRFTWPEDLHRDFVSAVFDVGLKHSSPSTILEHMPKHEQITSERIKSHLQKYRLHRAKSKKEFMASYESAVTKIQKEGLSSNTSMGGAQVPAHLTYVTMTEMGDSGVTKQSQVQQQQQQQQPPQGGVQTQSPAAGATSEPKMPTQQQIHQQQQQQEALMLPRLSEAEKQSPIGASMGYLMGLFFSLKQQLVSQRAAAAQLAAAAAANKNQPVAAVFDAFVSGNLPATGDITTVDGITGATNANNKLAPPNAVPSMRSNLEENNMMKREMKNQMTFQNKMRALKMQELKKLKTVVEDGSVMHLVSNAVSTAAAITATKGVANNNSEQEPQPLQHLSSQHQLQDPDQQQHDFQGAGEAAADGGGVMFEGERNRSMSIGASEDFWNTDVVDDQLFEFLMNN
jgi:SHAQKYF class myb-like DNA-binding protein